MAIFAPFQCLQPHLTATTLRQFSRMALAMLVTTGRVTMLGISRWAGKGGSYRTVQRFFSQALPWAMLFWVFFRQHVYRPGDVYLLAGDEVVVTKAGKHTYGLDRFFASLYSKVVPGLSCFALSLVSVQERRSFPIRVEQIIRSDAEKAANRAKAEAKKQPPSTAKRGPGRPKGSKNKAKAAVTLMPELVRIKSLLESLLHRITQCIPLTYLVLDGHFGNHNACTWPSSVMSNSSPSCAPTRLYMCPTKACLLGVIHIASMAANWITAASRSSISKPPPLTAPDPHLPGPTAPQRVRASAKCGHHRQDEPAYAC
jgi:putative transposase